MKAQSGTSERSQSHEEQENQWQIPLPKRPSSFQHLSQGRHATPDSSTPLLPIRQRKVFRRTSNNRDDVDRLYGRHWETTPDSLNATFNDDITESSSRLLNISTDATAKSVDNLSGDFHDNRPKGLAGFFFGFMYEEPFNDSFDYDDETFHSPETSRSLWNPLTIALFSGYALTTSATTVPVLLIPTMGQDFLNEAADVSVFASRAAASAVLGTACGKFLNGPVSDVLGARRTTFVYAILLAVSLVGMAFCQTVEGAAWACFFVEFFQSVQWPCILITLATHYGPHQNAASIHMYEGGIFLTSVASRLGSLLGIPIFSAILQRSHWRVVCLIGSWLALIGASVAHLFLFDSPLQINEPQNALHPSLLRRLDQSDFRAKPKQFLKLSAHVLHSIVVNNLIPSLQHVLKSGTFWIVAFAHTGSSMVRTSERILSTYYHDTSMGYLSEEKASGLSIFASLGTILGLAIAGTMFTYRKERQRKWLVSRLYIVTIAACYVLAILAVPRLYIMLDAPGLVLFFQIFASSVMGFGIAVMFYHIPGLVGSSFGRHKGMFAAYVDGVAYGLASFVWKIVANAVERGGGGWAYGWAAVALLIVLCGILMVEFMEHYFVRKTGKHYGTYETIIFA